jgi:uncharacterized membrane protein YjjB (DUF3815 family)
MSAENHRGMSDAAIAAAMAKERQQAGYNTILKTGLVGGAIGFTVGVGALALGARRYPFIKNLTLPFRGFLTSSATLVGATIASENKSIELGRDVNPMSHYKDEATLARELARQQSSAWERTMGWGRENRYTIVFGSWVAAMGLALAMVGRNKYLTGAQKLVQARVYAQGLTVAVLVATAAFETSDARRGESRFQTVKVLDPSDPTHRTLIEKRVHKEEYEGQDLWKDMVAAEERRLKALEEKKRA